MDRELIQKLYIRTCKDSGFGLDYIQAAILTAKTLGISPIEIWIAFGDFKIMERISKNNHPAIERMH